MRDLSICVGSRVYKLMFYLTIVNKTLRHCHSWLARQYMLKQIHTLSFNLCKLIDYSLWFDDISLKMSIVYH